LGPSPAVALFPYTTLFRSDRRIRQRVRDREAVRADHRHRAGGRSADRVRDVAGTADVALAPARARAVLGSLTSRDGRLMEESGSPTDVSGSGQVSHSR